MLNASFASSASTVAVSFVSSKHRLPLIVHDLENIVLMGLQAKCCSPEPEELHEMVL